MEEIEKIYIPGKYAITPWPDFIEECLDPVDDAGTKQIDMDSSDYFGVSIDSGIDFETTGIDFGKFSKEFVGRMAEESLNKEKSGFRANRSADSGIVRERDIKTGDVLTVRDWKWYDENRNRNGYVNRTFVPEMANYCGRRVIIVDIREGSEGRRFFVQPLHRGFDVSRNNITLPWIFESWMFDECHSFEVQKDFR